MFGSTGTGKSTLLLRLWEAFMGLRLSRHAAGLAGPPLIVILDCKGGADRAASLTARAGCRTSQEPATWPMAR